MRNLWRSLRVFTGQRFRNYLMAEANDLHGRAIALTVWIIGMGILAVLLNFGGLKVVNFYLAMLVNIIMIIIMTRPSVLLTIGVVGAVADQSLEGGKELLKKAADIYAHTLLYISILFLFSGIFSFRNNPGAIPMIIAALLVTFWMDKAGWFKPKFYRKVIYVFANCVIIFGILSFIPRAGYIKAVGFYPYSFIRVSDLEDKVSTVEEAEKKAMEKVAIGKLETINKKMDEGKELTAEEKNFWDEQKELMYSNSVSSRTVNYIGSLFTPNAVPVPKEQNVDGLQLKKGDNLSYTLLTNEGTPWILAPTGVNYNIHPKNKSHFRIYFWNGQVVDVGDKDIGLPDVSPAKFKIIKQGEGSDTFIVSGI